jgi:hypothetical protein
MIASTLLNILPISDRGVIDEDEVGVIFKGIPNLEWAVFPPSNKVAAVSTALYLYRTNKNEEYRHIKGQEWWDEVAALMRSGNVVHLLEDGLAPV